MAKRLATAVAFFKINIKNTFVYRGMLFLWLAGWLLQFITMYFLWHSSAVGNMVGDYSLNQLITYYFIGTLVVAICGWYPFYAIIEMIKDGSIVRFIIKPFDFFWYCLGFEVGWHFINTLLYLFFFAAIYFLVRTQIVAGLAKVSWIWFLLSLLIAALVSLEVNLILAAAAFWLTSANALGNLFWMAIFLLGGQAVPLSFFPAGWQTLVGLLPFRFMYSLPLEIYLGKLEPLGLTLSLIAGLIWTIMLYFIFKFVWQKGLRAYTAFGQ